MRPEPPSGALIGGSRIKDSPSADVSAVKSKRTKAARRHHGYYSHTLTHTHSFPVPVPILNRNNGCVCAADGGKMGAHHRQSS